MAIVTQDDAPQMLDAAARQLYCWLDADTLSRGALPTLHEHFPVVALSFDNLRAMSDEAIDLSAAVEPTGFWHVQIALGGTPYGYLRMTPEPEWAIAGVYETRVATAIDRAIDVADAKLPSDDYVTYLLDVPAYRAGALLFVPHSDAAQTRVIVYRTPAANTVLQRWRLYRATTLVRALLADAPAIGFVDDRKPRRTKPAKPARR